MKIAVCIKQVPGTTQVEVDPVTGTLKRDGVESKLNPYDLYALETALRLKEQLGAEVTALSMGPPQAEEILREIGAPELRGMLRLAGYIPNSDLPAIYNRASAFLYTSLRESFGIPLVEAMACGTPVITGNTSSMPEVGGPGILAIDPCRPAEIARAVLRLENEDTLYRRQREYGLLRARQFSWEKTADELIQVYRSLFK